MYNKRREECSEIWPGSEMFSEIAVRDQKTGANEKKKRRHKKQFYIMPAIILLIVTVLSEFNYEEYQETISYVVVEGDTLWDISRRYLGKGYKYIQIVVENENSIRNPDLIYPGDVYRISVLQRVKTDVNGFN